MSITLIVIDYNLLWELFFHAWTTFLDKLFSPVLLAHLHPAHVDPTFGFLFVPILHRANTCQKYLEHICVHAMFSGHYVDVCCTRSGLWLFVQVFLCDRGFLIEGSYGMSNVIGEGSWGT